MTNTSYQLIPKYYFGKGCIKNLLTELESSKYKRVLILYGGGSIKKNGVYQDVIDVLNQCKKIKYYEFSGIEPNPRDKTIDEAAKFCQKNKIDLILAVGGGSVIDASKVIGVVATNKHIKSSWDLIENHVQAKNDSIPIFSILTLAGTGSENNGGSVVTNWELKIKKNTFNTSAIPKVAFLDPMYTYSLPQWQLSSGIFDCLSHLLEQYYGQDTFYWSKEMIIANIKTLLASASILIKKPKDYEARANLMWTCAMSLNSTTSFLSTGDWNVHALEHAISAKWDVTHGAGLALITPTYIKVRSASEKWFKEKTLALGKEIFNTSSVNSFVEKLNQFIKQLKLPMKFSDFSEIKKITKDDIDFIVKHAATHRATLDKKYLYKITNAIKK